MIINIKIIDSADIWNSYENKIAPHTFLQSWEWGQCQEAAGQKIYRLGIFIDNELCGLAFFYLIRAKRGSFLFCPHGPLIDWQKSEEILPELIKFLIGLGRKEKVDFIRLSPLAPNSKENLNLFNSLGFRPAPVHMMHPELAWILDLSQLQDKLLANLEKRTRYSIRKAEKDGVIIFSSKDINDFDKFYSLYDRTAKRQGFVPFSRDYLINELKFFLNNDKILFYFAEYHNEIIATAIIVCANNSAFYHHGASGRQYPNITASELLQWTAINDAKNNNLSYYNFWGIAPDNAKKHPWLGLTKFKKGFGGFSEEYLHAQDYALTPKYWLNYAIEKLRKIKRGY
jgi:peptidoglycan pentaglycine glycine transferase (the first glycine)